MNGHQISMPSSLPPLSKPGSLSSSSCCRDRCRSRDRCRLRPGISDRHHSRGPRQRRRARMRTATQHAAQAVGQHHAAGNACGRRQRRLHEAAAPRRGGCLLLRRRGALLPMASDRRRVCRKPRELPARRPGARSSGGPRYARCSTGRIETGRRSGVAPTAPDS